MADNTNTVELTDDELKFVNELVDEAISAPDIERQDKAIELSEKLPESGFVL